VRLRPSSFGHPFFLRENPVRPSPQRISPSAPDRCRRFVHRDRSFPALVVCSAVCSGGNSAMLSMPIHRFRSSVAAGFAPCPNPRAAAGWSSVQALGTNCLQRSPARPIIPPHELIAAMQLAAARPFENLRSRGRLQRKQRATTGLLDPAITASWSGRSLPQITERLGFLLGRLHRGAYQPSFACLLDPAHTFC
jgi:hypothetical protein